MRFVVLSGLLVGLLCSVFQLMDVRDKARSLTTYKDRLTEQIRRLEDERRSLILEFTTYTEYVRIRQEAVALGMVEPSLVAGNLIYLKPPGSE